MDEYAIGDGDDCKNVVVGGARRLLEESPEGFKRKMPKDASTIGRLSPLIWSHAVEDVFKHQLAADSATPQGVCNGFLSDPTAPVSYITVIWSEKRSHAFMNSITFIDYNATEPPNIALSPHGLALVRSAWERVSGGKHEVMQNTFTGMLLEVGEELLKDSKVRAMAERSDWNLATDDSVFKYDRSGFTQALIIAVATNWNDKLKRYIPPR
ncbi:hypothetical protein FOZ63_011158, partial [Perkinsus olseni]